MSRNIAILTLKLRGPGREFDMGMVSAAIRTISSAWAFLRSGLAAPRAETVSSVAITPNQNAPEAYQPPGSG